MKLTIERINEVIKAGQNLEDSKLKFAFDKFVKRVSEAFKIAQEKFNEALEETQIDLCAVNEKGHVIRDENGGYVFDKENTKLLNKKAREIAVKELEFEFTGLLACPDNLTREQRESFSGILIPEQKEVDIFIYTSENGLDNVQVDGDITEQEKESITEQIKQIPELQKQ